MSLLARPRVAALAARVMQSPTAISRGSVQRSAQRRLTEYRARTLPVTIPTAVGPAPVTIYRPVDDDGTGAGAGTGGPRPVHINLHGGGYVLSPIAPDDPLCRALTALAGVVVINVDYAVAPQHPFPQPPEQVYDVLRWVAANGPEHGWDPHRITIGGQSSGGALAAATARLALERGGPEIRLQVLHYPPLDLTVPAAQKRSVIERPMLRPWMGEIFDSAYVPDTTQRGDRLVSPAGAADRADLTGIAPALVIAAEHDILRDEARRYADRLAAVGSLVEYHEVAGADHAYDMADDVRARATYERIANHIRAATTPRT